MVWVYDRTTGRRFQVPQSVAASMVRQDRYKYTTGNNADVSKQAMNSGRSEEEVQDIADAWTFPENTPGFGVNARPNTIPGAVTPYGVFPGIGIPNVAAATGEDPRARAPWDASDLTPEEQRQVESMIKTIMSQSADPDSGQWYSWGPDGQVVHSRTGMMAIEQGMKDYSDKVVGAVQNWYRDYLPPIEDLEGGDLADGWPDPFGGYGSGSGYAGPVYVRPDERVVEDTVKAMLVKTVGQADEERVERLKDVWYAGHKTAWDIRQTGGQDVDPNAAVLEQIRGSEDYKRIHKGRAEQEDEFTYISSRRGRLEQLGLSGADADERAIALAQTGTNVNDIDIGKAQTGMGNLDTGLRGKMKNAATLIARSL